MDLPGAPEPEPKAITAQPVVALETGNVETDELIANSERSILQLARSADPAAISHTPEPIKDVPGLGERAPRELALAEPESASAEAVLNPPIPPVRRKAHSRPPFAGVWGASREACRSEMQREGHLLTYINLRRARAGDTVCMFQNTKRRASAWHMEASCSDGQATWKSDVRLSVTRGRLTWSSQKGVTTYFRCLRI